MVGTFALRIPCDTFIGDASDDTGASPLFDHGHDLFDISRRNVECPRQNSAVACDAADEISTEAA